MKNLCWFIKILAEQKINEVYGRPDNPKEYIGMNALTSYGIYPSYGPYDNVDLFGSSETGDSGASVSNNDTDDKLSLDADVEN